MTLKQYLKAEGYGTLSRLATEAETSKGYISDIAKGRRRPSPDVAKKIELATDGKVRAFQLLGLEAA